jgi:hypothetical protein
LVFNHLRKLHEIWSFCSSGCSNNGLGCDFMYS